MDARKALKKLVLMNRFSVEEISRMSGIKITDIPREYKAYTGLDIPDTLFVVGHDEEISKLKGLILSCGKVIIHGPPGCGKSIAARKAIQLAGKIMKEINISEYRTPDLLNERLFGSHATPSDIVLLFEEVDNFYWRSHASFSAILEEAVAPIIMTCNDFDRVPEGVKKQCVIMRMRPPSMNDLQTFVDKKFPELSLKVKELYHPDFREVMRRILFEVRNDTPPEKEYNAEAIAGMVFGEQDRESMLKRLENASDPLTWSITWLDHNSARLAPSIQGLITMLDGLSTMDSWARRTKQKYIASMFVGLPNFNRHVKLEFPAQLFAAEKKKEKAKVVEDGVSKVSVKKKAAVVNTADTFGEF